jgi:phosphate transport system substrate-binding protein
MSPARFYQARGWVALALVGAVLCAGCRNALIPLPQSAQVAQGERGEPVLVRIAACWPSVPLVESLIAAYGADDANLSFDLIPTTSPVALAMLGAGQVELAIVGYLPDAEQLAPLSGAGHQAPESRILALDTVGVIVPQASPLRAISRADLAALFAGQRLDWSELGAGQGRPDLVSLGQGSTVRGVVEREVMGELAISSAAIIMPHDGGVVDYVATHAGAVGYASLAYADERVRALALDGVAPTANEARSGRYPLTHPLVALYLPHPLREALALLDLAQSSRGRVLIEKRYAVPR